MTLSTMPSHNHPFIATTDSATTTMPEDNLTAQPPGLLGTKIYADGVPNTMMHAAAINNNPGGDQAHNNMQPYLGLNYIIALTGVFPARS